MRNLGHIFENTGAHWISGQRLEGGGADKPQRGLGGDDPNVMTRLAELTHHRAGLVGRDATGDADDDPLGAHRQHPRSPRLLAFGVFEQIAVNLPQGQR